MNIVYVASLALYNSAQQLLIAKRPDHKSMAGLWEFPGGKIEPNETPEACLIREAQEELAITLHAQHLKETSFTSYSYPDFHLVMLLFTCHHWTGHLHGNENQILQWVDPSELLHYPMPEANADLIAFLR